MTAAPDLSDLFARTRTGDRHARNEIVTALYDRMVRLTAAVLKGFPLVRRRREPECVAADLWVKLIKALDAGLPVPTAADFFRYAGTRLRQLLIDEVEKIRRRGDALSLDADADGSRGSFEPGTAAHDPAVLAEWGEFHNRVGTLPADERTVVEMHFFRQMPQADIARSLGWEPKQVSRKWLSAASRLADHVPSIA